MNSISSPTELVFMYTLTLYHKILLLQRKRKSKSKLGSSPQTVLEYSKAKLMWFEFDFRRVLVNLYPYNYPFFILYFILIWLKMKW